MMNDDTFNLDRLIAERLDDGSGEPSEVLDQALAVLVDSAIPEDKRASSFVKVMSDLLARLSPNEFLHFRELAELKGQSAAMEYLGAITRPQQFIDRTRLRGSPYSA
jgi:hypothetical protein